MTDTGSFSFASNNEKTYNVTADLIGLGVDAEKIHRLVYDTFSENRLRLLGHAISQRLIIWDELHVALIYLTREDLREFHYQVGDAEGVVNYPLMMEKINVSVLLSERDNQIRISFRSKGDFSVNEVARKFFKGGGHRNAAGGKSFVSMDKTIKSIKEVLEQYRDSLDYKISY
jgi:phosphoesterase RecJ-like protein